MEGAVDPLAMPPYVARHYDLWEGDCEPLASTVFRSSVAAINFEHGDKGAAREAGWQFSVGSGAGMHGHNVAGAQHSNADQLAHGTSTILLASILQVACIRKLHAPAEIRLAALPVRESAMATRGRWQEGITEEDMNDFRWLRPGLRLRIGFMEREASGLLRHSKAIALTART